MRKVRIIRKTKSMATMACNWLNLSVSLLNLVARPQVQANLDYIQSVRVEKIQTDTQVAEMRKQKMANDLVLQDMKIELMKAELAIRGVGQEPFAPESAHAH